MPNRLIRDWTDSIKVNSLSVNAERFFIRLIMKVDDYGCLFSDTRLLRASLFPFLLEQVRDADLTRWMAECQKAGLVRMYESSGKGYLQILDFNQRLDRSRSKFPLPEGDDEIPTGGYVYLMQADDKIKIGFSINPWARVKEVSGSVGKTVVVIMTFKGSMDNEKALQKLLRKFNYEKEWFILPKHVLDSFQECYNSKKSATEATVVIRSRLEVEVEVELEVEREVEQKPAHPLGKKIVTPLKTENKEQSPGAEKWTTWPAETYLTLPLPEIKVGSVIELFKITKNTDVTAAQVRGLWNIFKTQYFTGKKFYQDVSDTYSHFINWCKTQNISKNETDRGSNGRIDKNTGAQQLLSSVRDQHNSGRG